MVSIARRNSECSGSDIAASARVFPVLTCHVLGKMREEVDKCPSSSTLSKRQVPSVRVRVKGVHSRGRPILVLLSRYKAALLLLRFYILNDTGMVLL